MILKFKREDGWAFHESDEIRTEDGRFDIDEIEGAYIYTAQGQCQNKKLSKLLYFRNGAGSWQGVLYLIGYLLNEKGDTINTL